MRIIDQILNANNVSTYSVVKNGNLVVEHAELIFKNFEGRGTLANPVGGKRTFCLLLNEEYAAWLSNNNWNVKVKEIKDQYQENEKTMTVSWEEYDNQYRNVFDHAAVYTEIVVKDDSETPPEIFKASEFNGEKVRAKVPVEHWKDLDRSVFEDVTVVVHPWKHGRNAMNPEAKKGYLNTLIAKIQPVSTSDIGETYSDYRIIDE